MICSLSLCLSIRPHMQNKSVILDILRDRDEMSCTDEDKLRLVIIYFLSMPDNAVTKEDMAELVLALKTSGADMSALEYVKRSVKVDSG